MARLRSAIQPAYHDAYQGFCRVASAGGGFAVGMGLVIALGLTILDRLDVALAAMHRSGSVSARFGQVATPDSLWSRHLAGQRISAWRDWDADRLAAGLSGHVVGPYRLVAAYAAADSILVVAPVTALLLCLLCFVAGRARTRTTGSSAAFGDSGEQSRSEALLTIASVAVLPALAYGALDLLENGAVVAGVWSGAPAWVALIGLLSLGKTVALALAVLPLLVLVVATPAHRARQLLALAGRWWAALTALRAQFAAAVVVLAVFLALRGDTGLQIDDAIMRWLEQPSHLVFAVVIAVGASWLFAVSAVVSRDAYRQPPRGRASTAAGCLATAGLGVLLLAAGLLAALGWHHTVGYALVFPGAVLVFLGLLSLPAKVRAAAARRDGAERDVDGLDGWIRLLASVPLLGLGLAVTRAAVTLGVTQERSAWILSAVATFLFALSALVLLGRARRLVPGWVGHRRIDGAGAWRALLPGVAPLLAGLWAGWRPQQAGPLLGAVGLALLLVACLVVVLTALVLLGDSDALAPRGALALVGLRRTPMIVFLVLWFATSSLLDRSGHYHDVRLGGPLNDRPALTIDQALDAWLARVPAGPAGVRQRVPMVFVATAGGGIRAAYWTDLVLDCLFAAQPVEPACRGQRLDKGNVFAASGISGGSLGLAVDRALEGSGLTYDDVLQRDFLSPDVAALTFRDLPNGLLRLEPRDADRAAVMERAWEDAFGRHSPLARGLFEMSVEADGRPRFPLLLLNSATVDDGCRLDVSVLSAATSVRVGPRPPAGTENCLALTPFAPGRDAVGGAQDTAALGASKDVYDYLCTADGRRHDLRLSTAAHLSARFPYVSPTGALTRCGQSKQRTFALDGGLVETSGVSSLTEIWARLSGRIQQIDNDPTRRVCIEPRLLMVDNGYLQDTPAGDPSRPQELLAPPSGLSKVTSVRSARAEQVAALAFDHAFGAVACHGPGEVEVPREPVAARVAHIVPLARPGPQAPLGWSLSRFARRDLAEQLRSPNNLCQIALVRSWYATPQPGSARCVTGFAVRDPYRDGGPDSLRRFDAVDSSYDGVANLRLTVDDCADVPLPQLCSVTTDAAGSFSLLVRAGRTVPLTVRWGASRLALTLPNDPAGVQTGLNFLVAGAGAELAPT
jgi:hypothetical protein